MSTQHEERMATLADGLKYYASRKGRTLGPFSSRAEAETAGHREFWRAYRDTYFYVGHGKGSPAFNMQFIRAVKEA